MFARMLKSSRVQTAAVGLIVACVVAGAGWSDSQADRLTEILLWVVGIVTTAVVGGTALEDAASKRAGGSQVTVIRGGQADPTDPTRTPSPASSASIARPDGFTRGVPNVLTLLILSAGLLTAGPGCSFLAPGADVRQAAESRSVTSWTGDDNLNITEDTTHNRRTVMLQGEGVKAEYYPDGTPKSVDGATHVLTQWSEPKDAMGAYIQLAEENARVAGRMIDVVDRLLSVLPGGGAASAPAAPEPSRLDRVLGFLERQARPQQ